MQSLLNLNRFIWCPRIWRETGGRAGCWPPRCTTIRRPPVSAVQMVAYLNIATCDSQAMLILSNTSHCQSTLSAFLVVQRAFASLILHTMCTWRSLGHNFYDSYKVFLSDFLISNAFSERISKMKINKSGLNVCGKLVTLLLKLISWKFQVISKPLSSRENWTFLA